MLGPLFIVIVMVLVLVRLVLFAHKQQSKMKEKFEVLCREEGWKRIEQSGGYDILPQNDERWKFEFRPSGGKNTPPSVTWSHPRISHTPLVILTKTKLGIVNDAAVHTLQMSQPEEFGTLSPIPLGSSDFTNRFAVYGATQSTEHPFFTPELERKLLSYFGANVVLVLLSESLEIRLRDRNVYSQFPAVIRLGKEIIELQKS